MSIIISKTSGINVPAAKVTIQLNTDERAKLVKLYNTVVANEYLMKKSRLNHKTRCQVNWSVKKQGLL